MKILALETSANACSVALHTQQDNFNWFEVVGSQHAKLLLPQIEYLLKQAKFSLAEIDLLAVGQGPGSFTGLRIGASVIQGLSLAHNLPVIGVSSLQALALQATKQYPTKTILSLIDARMSEVYMGLYAPNNQSLTVEQVISPLAIDLPSADILVVGTGAKEYEDVLQQKFPQVSFDLEILYPRAQEIAEIAAKNPISTEQLILPQYLRNNVTDRSKK